MNMNLNQCALAAVVGGVGSYYFSNKLMKTKLLDIVNRLKASHTVVLRSLTSEPLTQTEIDAAIAGFTAAIGSLEKLSV